MIRLRGLGLAQGAKLLLENADALIAPGEKIALIGANGSGKTTLLRALAGEIAPDAGEIENSCRQIVRLEQSLPTGDKPAWQHVVDSDPALRAANHAVHDATERNDGHAIGDAYEALAQAGGLDAQARARSLLTGLGFTHEQAQAPVSALSGGWRMRLNLAQVLFVPSELLLLDEPTNHLDLDAILWLERWLLRYEGSVLIVSHDRDFLDGVVRATLSIEDQRLFRYTGGYSACEQQRAERQMLAERRYRRDSDRAAHLQRFVDRFRAKATKARQVQSRVKALERLSLEAPNRAANGLDFRLNAAGESPDPLIHCEALCAGYSEPVLSHVRMHIERGARIGLLGRNGAGKTTLIRTLVGDLPAISGELQRAGTVRIGYFAQQGVERLRADDSPLSHLARVAPQAREPVLRGFLGRFGFGGEDALRPIGPMSGGEKSRVLLAELIFGKPQLLILDEPTNHLDAMARDSLTDALAEFDGALLLVSHDRYLLRATVDRFVLVHDACVQDFDGDLDDYAAWLQSRAGAAPGADGKPARTTQKRDRRSQASRRIELSKQLKPIEREISSVEKRTAEFEQKISAIDTSMADTGFHADSQRVADSTRIRAQYQGQLDTLERRWFELNESRENLLKQADSDAI